jgi:prolyl oligopeptidase
MYKFSILFLLTLSLLSCSKPKEQTAMMKYPITEKATTVDTLFGIAVSDPYRWLEDDTAKATANWVKAQNEVTFGFLNKIPYRDLIKERLEKIYNYERFGTPSKHGDYLYFSKNNGLQNQSLQYRKKGDAGEAEIFLDPNAFSSDGTSRLAGMSFSKDGSLCAYQVAKSGADWNDAIIIRAVDKKVMDDTLKNLKFSGISWKGNEGFYYSKYDKDKKGSIGLDNHKIYYHQLNTPYTKDVLLFGDNIKRRYAGASLTEDQRYLIVSAANGTYGNDLYAQDLKDPKGKLVAIVNNLNNSHNFIDNIGSKFLIQTDLGAPNNRLVEFDFAKPSADNWKDLIPEAKNVANFGTVGGKIFADYTVDVKSVIKQFNINGKFEHDVELPGIGSAGWGGGLREDKEIYYSFTSFLYPTTIFKYEIASGKSSTYAQPKLDFNASEYEMKQVFYSSKDSTKIPMFIVHKKGLKLDGTHATMLYGYGGFNISLTPFFDPSLVVWLENGGIYAQPNLRGGGEYGEEWHQAGTKMKKQNVFDDFIAAAEYLIKEKYTSSNYLAIQGGSNGGLLVGATMAQRPDLFKVALPGVGVMDMLRYHKFTAGPGWAPDYGTADDSKEMFEYLKKYSPVHALKTGINYPATLVNTADHDDRVVPAHSFKFAATLQEVYQGTNPVLIRIDAKSAHGSSNLSKAIALDADQFAFTWYNMGLIPPLAKKEM